VSRSTQSRRPAFLSAPLVVHTRPAWRIGADCFKLAKGINAYADKNKDLLTRLKELEKRITPAPIRFGSFDHSGTIIPGRG
jgi:hypothetical protein